MKYHLCKTKVVLGFFAMLLFTAHGQIQPVRTFAVGLASGDTAPRPRSILYLGRAERVFHDPVAFYEQCRRAFAERGLKFTFTSKIFDLNTPFLSEHDGLFMFGDVQTSASASEVFGRPFVDAIVDYVEAGGGLTGMHVASACFRNSADFEALLGGRFLGHFPYQEFTPNVPNLVNHPITEGLGTYTSFDEPYQNININPDITLLGTRDGIGNEADGQPYTWIRTQEAGRVFYHANGHDTSSWSQPNFQELMIRGTEWVARAGSGHLFEKISGLTLTPTREISFVAEVEVDGVLQQGVFSGDSDTPQRATLSGEALFDNNSAGMLLDGPQTSVVLVGNGMVAMTSMIERIGIDGDSAAFLLGPTQCPHLVAASGIDCPAAGVGITYAEVKEFVFETSNLEEVVIQAVLDNPNEPSEDSILLRTDGVATTKILMEGDLLQGVGVISDLTEMDFSLSDSGLLALICEVTENENVSQMIVSDRNDALMGDLQSGISYPGLPNDSVIEHFEWVEIRDSGEILFIASLAGLDVTPENDQVLCRLSITGDITVMMREGEIINGGTVQVPIAGWKAASSESHLAITISYIREGETQAVPALVLASNTSASVVLAEGEFLSERNESYRVKFIPDEKASCQGGESIIKVILEDEIDATPIGDALVLLGRLQPRIIVRAGWQIPTQNGSILVDQLDFESNSHGQSGHSLSGGLVFFASAVNGDGQIVFSNLSDSLDGDLFNDDFEIAFGGDADSNSTSPPAGALKIQAETNGGLTLNFWANELFLDSYELYESTDLEVWTKAESLPIVSPDQSGVAPNFQRFHYQIENLSENRFFIIQLNQD